MTEITMTEHQPQTTAVVREGFRQGPPAVLRTGAAPGDAGGPGPGQAPGRAAVSLYHGMPTNAVDVEAGFPVDGPISAAHGVTRVPAGRSWKPCTSGPTNVPQTYEEVGAYMNERGLSPSSDMWEVYLSDPEREPDPATWRTQVFWPVA